MTRPMPSLLVVQMNPNGPANCGTSEVHMVLRCRRHRRPPNRLYASAPAPPGRTATTRPADWISSKLSGRSHQQITPVIIRQSGEAGRARDRENIIDLLVATLCPSRHRRTDRPATRSAWYARPRSKHRALVPGPERARERARRRAACECVSVCVFALCVCGLGSRGFRPGRGSGREGVGNTARQSSQ